MKTTRTVITNKSLERAILTEMTRWDARTTIEAQWERPQTEVIIQFQGEMACEFCKERTHPDYIIMRVPPNSGPSFILCETHYKTHWMKVFGGND